MIKFITEEKAWILSHLIWLAAVGVALVVGHIALQEHDQRVLADATIKTSQATIANLESQIVTTNAQAAQKVQTVVKIVHDLGPTPTTGQVVASIPQLTDAPLNARPAADNPAQVSVDATPFLNLLAQAKTDSINLGACQSDLKNETAIAGQKDVEIAALKKKPSLLKRVKHIAEAVGVGIAIGLVLK
jgi:hypothetical protein